MSPCDYQDEFAQRFGEIFEFVGKLGLSSGMEVKRRERGKSGEREKEEKGGKERKGEKECWICILIVLFFVLLI